MWFGISSVSFGVGGVFLKVVREDLRGNEELSDVAAFSAGPEDAFIEMRVDQTGGLDWS